MGNVKWGIFNWECEMCNGELFLFGSFGDGGQYFDEFAAVFNHAVIMSFLDYSTLV